MAKHRVRRAEVDYPTVFTLTPDEFRSIMQAGGVRLDPQDESDIHRMWERLLVQYVERATLHWPEYKKLKTELERLRHAASKGHRAFAKSCRALDTTAINPAKAPGEAGHVRLRPAHKEEALDIIEPELTRQLGDQWRALLDDEELDLNAVRQLLHRQIEDYAAIHGVSGRERQPDLEWFIDQAADLFIAVGGNAAANGREREGKVEGTTEYYRAGPFIDVVKKALSVAADHAARLGVHLPSGDIPELVHSVVEKRRAFSKR